MKTLFLEQSYKDVNKYLKDNINNKKYDAWDYIVFAFIEINIVFTCKFNKNIKCSTT